MPEPVVSNSSCIIALDNIQQLDILKKLYGQILIPEAVKAELGVETPTWIKTEKARDTLAVQTLLLELEEGEAESIILAMEKGKAILILDDRKARNIAIRLGLSITGTLGVLIRAKRESLISNLKNVLEQLEGVNFRLTKELKEKALELAGEAF